MKNKDQETEGRLQITVRIAPSPTGNLHIGTARLALFNYLFAKQKGGKIILRMEDTDKERSRGEFEENIKEGLEWLGISWDEFVRQSERTDIYKSHLNKLIEEDKAYVSKEAHEPEQVRFGVKRRDEVIRFRNPNKKVKFSDLIRGEIEFDTTELKDFVIAKSMDEPLYHLAVVVDDHEGKVSHIIRGEDHISNTPRQILIQEALGFNTPIYAHLPLVLNEKRAKLSKRDGATSLDEFREDGYIKEALINFLASLGWAKGDDQEIFTLEELISHFDLEKVNKAGAIFNVEKLNWFNQQYIKKLNDKEILSYVSKDKKDLEQIKKALPEIKERIVKLGELETIFDSNQEFDYLVDLPKLDMEKINWKENSKETTKGHLDKVLGLLEGLDPKDFESDKIKTAVWDYAEQEGKGDVLWPTRYALSGKEKSMNPFTLSFILGKEETLKRLANAIAKIK
jgi:glutamyl-tRNA synthetase